MHGGGNAINKIIDLWANGLTFSQISIQIGMTKKEVTRHVYEFRVRGSITSRKPAKRKIGILDLRYKSCRYIIGEDEDIGTLYCGDAAKRQSYCAHHYALCYLPTPKR